MTLAATSARRLAIAAAVAIAAAAIPVTIAVTPAAASLSTSDWVMQALPANFQIWQGAAPIDPVSCVSGTQFCVAITSDLAVAGVNGTIGFGALVTTNGGASWNGYPVTPSASMSVTSLSCVSASVCWAAGPGAEDQPEVAESTDGGQNWTLMTPTSWASGGPTWWPNAIDCVSATTCWLAGMTANSVQSPVVASTTDGGATWVTFNNLPSFAPYDPNGTYLLNGISCTSALACVAVGGLNEADGRAQVIATTDGGVTWSLSSDPTLAGLQMLFSVSCIPVPGSLPTCHAAADALESTGPVMVTSTDGGVTWSGVETYDNTGWMNSISCPDVRNCWGAAAGTKLSLVGTSDGGANWSAVTSDATNNNGEVSCASVSFCIATTDSGLWVTTDGGGAATQAHTALVPGTRSAQRVTQRLPKVSGQTAYARTGSVATLTGQYRGSAPAKSAKVTIVSPAGQRVSSTVPIRLNHFYSANIGKVATGVTTISFTAGNAKTFTVHLIGHPGPAPTISALSSHAGPAAGGSALTIRGTNFSGVTAVYIGDRKATKISVISATTLKVRTPAGTGARFAEVRTARGGQSQLTGRATYNFLPVPALVALKPASGPPGGGTLVTIRGVYFGYVTAVYFGSHRGTHLQVISPRLIRIVAPPGTGTVNVRVRTAGGITAIVAADRYTY